MKEIEEQQIFFGIGAQKAGTSWLYHNLKTHPAIKMSAFKETHFFDNLEKNKGLFFRYLFSKRMADRIKSKRFYRACTRILIGRGNAYHWWVLKYLFLKEKKENIPAFRKMLEDWRGKNPVTGEMTPDYSILSTTTIQLVHQHFPKSKLIFILRDPIEREWSSAKMTLLKHKGKKAEEYDAQTFREFLNNYHIRSDYPWTIKNWLSFYPKDQLLFLFYDDLKKDPLAFLNACTEFLGLEPFTATPQQERRNQGASISITPEFEKLLFQKFAKDLEFLSDYFQEEAVNYPQLWLEKYRNKYEQ